MKSKGIFYFITVISIIIAIIGFFMIILYGYDRPKGSEGIGPRGGHWHITSGGNKSYYQPKTDNWGQKEINKTGKIGWSLTVIFSFLALGSGILINKINQIKIKSPLPKKDKKNIKKLDKINSNKNQKSLINNFLVNFDEKRHDKDSKEDS